MQERAARVAPPAVPSAVLEIVDAILAAGSSSAGSAPRVESAQRGSRIARRKSKPAISRTRCCGDVSVMQETRPDHVWSIPPRLDERMPVAGNAGDSAAAEGICRPEASDRALGPARHQAAAARSRVARHLRQRRGPQGQHQAAARGDGRRCRCPAVHRDGAPPRLPFHRTRVGRPRRRRARRACPRCAAPPIRHGQRFQRRRLRRRTCSAATANLASCGNGWSGARGRAPGRVCHRRTGHRQDDAGQRAAAGGLSRNERVGRARAVPGTVRRRRSVTCPCSKDSPGLAARQAANESSNSCGSTRRRGSSSCRRCCRRRNARCSGSRSAGATRERMLREMAEAIEAIDRGPAADPRPRGSPLERLLHAWISWRTWRDAGIPPG